MSYIFSIISGLVIALLMFLGMHFMISSDNQMMEKTKKNPRLIYLREKNDEKVEKKKRVKPKKEIKKPPLKKIKIQTNINTNIKQNIKIKPFKVENKNIDISAISSLNGAQIAVSNMKPTFVDANSLTALKRVNPRYPRRAKRRNIEGHVQLTFSINEKGEVSNITVLNSKPAGIFDENSIRAIKKWRFKTGNAQNATITFNFRLAQ